MAIAVAATTPPARWRKVLYVQQPYPDNHIDESFLDELQRNVNVRTYDYAELVAESTSITLHVTSVVLFGLLFFYTWSGSLSGMVVLGLGSTLSLIGYVIWRTVLQLDQEHPDSSVVGAAKAAGLFFATLMGLSPVLKTLTEDTSSDTVWAFVCILFLVNMLFHDYSPYRPSDMGRFPGSLSLNAAILASVMLASRLRSVLDVFALLAFAMEWFALFPIFRQRLKFMWPCVHRGVTVVAAALATALLLAQSSVLCVLYLAAVIFLTFLAPYWLIWVQRYKKAHSEIHGPWDEARVVIDSTMVAQAGND